LKKHLTELISNFTASMTQFDMKILDELGINDDEDDDESPEDEDEL
jgi:hypothetical protein